MVEYNQVSSNIFLNHHGVSWIQSYKSFRASLPKTKPYIFSKEALKNTLACIQTSSYQLTNKIEILITESHLQEKYEIGIFERIVVELGFKSWIGIPIFQITHGNPQMFSKQLLSFKKSFLPPKIISLKHYLIWFN